MDPNQINQMNNLNQINQMSIYQNYLLNNENKLDPQANMNLLYNFQQYYKGQQVRNITNSDANGVNINQSLMNQIPLQTQITSTTPIQSNATPNSNLFTTNYSNNFLNVDTPNYNVIDGENNTNSDNSSQSYNNFNYTQNLQVVSESFGDKQYQDNKNEQEMDRPWDRVSKDPSIIQKGTELFVGNLSLDTTENDLYDTFKDSGEVIDIRVHKNHQNKNCYAFIRMLTKEMLREAMNKNMTILKGRKMKITKSNENSTIFIGNIRKNWKNSDIETKFPNCEKIENFPDPNNPSKNRGFCFVVFKNRNDAIKALNYVNNKGGINIDGVPLTCDWADVIDEDDNNSKQIFISGLNEDITEENLKSIFSDFGRIESIILSREHKNSKRKDLAFLTYNTHEEAKFAVDNFKFKQDSKDSSVSLLGDRACVSLAFSQQAMQNKKKIKESRRKTTDTTQISNILGKAGSGNLALDQNRSGVLGNINFASLPNLMSNIPQNLQANNTVPGIDLSTMNSNNTNTTALLTMMNLLNMNKINMNINPALFNQMMSACLESIMSQNISSGNASILAQASQNLQNLNVQNSGIQNFNRLNNFNNFNNPTTLNTLKSLNNFNTLTSPNQVSLFNNSNYPFSQILNLGAPKINNTKRTKKFNQKKSYNSNPFLNANNPNSA